MTSNQPKSLAARARARFNGSALRESMTPQAIRNRIRRGPDAAERWPANSTSVNPAARTLDAATGTAGNDEQAV